MLSTTQSWLLCQNAPVVDPSLPLVDPLGPPSRTVQAQKNKYQNYDNYLIIYQNWVGPPASSINTTENCHAYQQPIGTVNLILAPGGDLSPPVASVTVLSTGYPHPLVVRDRDPTCSAL